MRFAIAATALAAAAAAAPQPNVGLSKKQFNPGFAAPGAVSGGFSGAVPGAVSGGFSGAVPGGFSGVLPGTVPQPDGTLQCGTGTQLYCCNQVKDPKGTQNLPPFVNGGVSPKPPGLLDGLLGAIIGPDGLVSHLLGQCARVDVAVPGGADVLSSQCKAKAACCHNSPSIAYGGLINIALPCIAFDGLL